MYTTYFGFQEKPFSVTPDPRFFYANRTYEEAYANLVYGIRERKGFLLLTGEVGTGKTTILRRLIDELESIIRFVFFYNTTLSFDELLEFTCDELGLKVAGGGRLHKIQALNEFLLGQLRKGSTVVLFIDEAQNLSDEVFENLRLLSNLETPKEKLLQMVLAGQPELDLKLDRRELRQFKQRIFSLSRLGALSEEEVGAFIDYRLKAVGYGRSDLFPRDAIREIALYSKGIPRLVNIICDNALLIAYADSKKRISREIINEVAHDLQLGFAARIPEAQATASPTSSYRRKPAEYLPETIRQNRSMHVAGPRNPNGEVKEPSIGTVPQCLAIMASELTEAMGPMAPLVVRSHLAALDESLKAVPAAGLEKLVELVSSEILNDLLRARFQEKMSALIGSLKGRTATLQA